MRTAGGHSETTTAAHASGYVERLSLHIDDYIQAVLDFPEVRCREFLELKDFADLQSSTLLLEVPTEGRMLDQCFPDSRIDRVDFLKLSIAGYAERVIVSDWSLYGIAADAYDGVLSVVPIHHANASEKNHYLQGAFRVLRPGGVLAFAEVEAGSSVEHFLDEFIDQHTVTGHRGEYPDTHFCEAIRREGFVEVSSEVRDCPWVFESETLLCAYATQLFALKPMATDTLLSAMDAALGLKQIDGKLHLTWPLRFFRGVKPLVA